MSHVRVRVLDASSRFQPRLSRPLLYGCAEYCIAHQKESGIPG